MMGAHDLILHLRESGFSIGFEDSRLQIAPADKLTDELKQTIRESKAEILTELQREQQREARRLKVIAMLEASPDRQRAVFVDTGSDPHNVILAVAVRNPTPATCEMTIPKDKYDPWPLLELIERHGQTTH
jgi:hypothetical protein